MTRRLSFLLSLVAACGGGSGATVQQQDQSVKLRVEALDNAVAGTSVPILISVRRGNATVRDYAGMLTFNVDDPAAWHPTSYRFTEADAGQHVFDVGFVFPQGVHVLTVEGEGIDEPAILGISVPLGSGQLPNFGPPPVPPPPAAGEPLYFHYWQTIGETGDDSTLADVDGDGDLDQVVAGMGVGVWTGTIPGTAAIWLNDGTGTFTKSSQQFSLFDNRARRVACADADGDGDVDIFLANLESVRLWVNRGDGTFDVGSEVASGYPYTFALGDVDGDGDEDIVLAYSWFFDVRLNDGKGGFGTLLQHQVAPTSYVRPALADLDGDGDLDLVAGKTVWRNDGKGKFTTTGQQFDRDMSVVALADMDGDGRIDLILGNYYQPNDLYLNDGNASFTRSPLYNTAAYCTTELALVDLDEDGDLDIIEGVLTTGSLVWLNELNQGTYIGQSVELELQLVPLPTARIVVGDLDGDGRPDFAAMPFLWDPKLLQTYPEKFATQSYRND